MSVPFNLRNRTSLSDETEAARLILSYLSEEDPLPATLADAVIGFGVFDLRVPRLCGDLYDKRMAAHLIFTGGIGAGTGQLGAPEADAWRAELARSHPHIDRVILENRSTNTAENISFTADLLERDHPHLAFGRGIRRVVVVTSPSRLRRVHLTLARLQPDLHVVRRCPSSDYVQESDLYAQQGLDYLVHLAGEVDRIVSYGERGWIQQEAVPPRILAARRSLRVSSEGGRGFKTSEHSTDSGS